MKREEINALLRERAVLERMLDDTPEEELIERRSMASRIDTINQVIGPDTKGCEHGIPMNPQQT